MWNKTNIKCDFFTQDSPPARAVPPPLFDDDEDDDLDWFK